MKLLWTVTLLACALLPCVAQDHSDWQALAALRAGDRVRLTLRSHKPVTGAFEQFNTDQVTVAGVAAKKVDVIRVETFRAGGWSRGKTAAVGALIGAGAGAAIGAAAGGCHTGNFICFSRSTVAAVLGVFGAVVGALIGVVIPHHRTDVIYTTK